MTQTHCRIRTIRLIAVIGALSTAAVLGGAGASQAGTGGPAAPQRHVAAQHAGVKTPATAAAPGRQRAFDEVARKVKEHGRLRVTLTLASAPTGLPTTEARARLAREAAHGRTAALRALGGETGTTGAPGAPAMTAEVDARDVAALRREGAVLSIHQSQVYRTGGTSSFGAASGVQVPKWWHRKWEGLDWTRANGYTGAGQKVVVVDTGTDSTHPWLQGRVVDGACFSQAGCGNGLTYRYGVAAGKPCTYSTTCAHGTHVAHIAAGKYGVAPGARIVAINASSRSSSGPTFYDADLVNSLWYAYTYVPNAAAVNLSLWTNRVYANTCDSLNPSMTSWVTALRNRGTATVLISGNGNSARGIASFACISTAVVVGNATLTGRTGTPAVHGGVAGGSNSSPLVDLWAPGTDICSAVPFTMDTDGTRDGVDCGYRGTSMAAPQVAGAFAVLKAARPAYTVNQSLSALVRNGYGITDSRNGVRRSMVSVSNAVYYG